MRSQLACLVTSLILAVGSLGPAEARELRVPTVFPQISEALSHATVDSSDVVLVSNLTESPYTYTSFTMKTGIPVLAAVGQTPVIDGADNQYAVDWPTTADSNTILRGFTIQGGTSASVAVRDHGVIKQCSIENDSAPQYAKGIRSTGHTVIDSCSVTVSGTTNLTGIYHDGGPPTITDCTVDVSDSTGIYVSCPSPSTGGTVSNCTINMNVGTGLRMDSGSFLVEDIKVSLAASYYYNAGLVCGYTDGQLKSTIEDCFVSAPGGVGVYVNDDSVTVRNITVDNVGTGFFGYYQTIHNCIVTNYNDGYEYAYENIVAVNCIADGTNPYDTGAQGTGSVIDDPLYCDASGGEYTLRVDSYGNPENNDTALIGAFPVACMYGTLQRETEFTVGGTLAFTGDAVVPDATSLTLGQDTILDISDSDGEAGGSDDQKVELIVEDGGSLDVQGASGHLVQFASTGSEGDWWGVHVEQGGSASIAWADFQDATQAVVYQGSGTGSISDCTFSKNENVDIYAGALEEDMDLAIARNVLTVGGGVGILLDETATGAAVDTNEVTGTTASTAGISEGVGTSGATPTYTGNTISWFQNGAGIKAVNYDAVMTGNTISHCRNGIEVHQASPSIGLAGEEDSDNILQANFTAILCDGTNGTSAPVIRNNQITSYNTYGVVANHAASPNLGTTGSGGVDPGDNTLTNSYSWCIANYWTGTVSAEGNFFGESEGCPAPTCTYGGVDATNWLCTEPVGAEVAMGPLEPKGFHLLGAGPNPMTGAGKIYFSLEDGQARVHGQVFDISGRRVRDLGETVAGPGTHVLDWDGRSDVGIPVRSGIYFVRVEATNGFQGTTKVLVTR